MLSFPAPFPHPGAEAFLKKGAFEDLPAGTPCKIIQADQRGRVSIAFGDVSKSTPDLHLRASGNRTVARRLLAETLDEAMGIAPRKPRRRARAHVAAGGSANGKHK